MQAAAQAVLRSAASSGHDTKTVIVFTHFDQVVGDNLPGVTARRNHVLASLENAIDSVDSTIGSGVGRRLQRILAARIFFVSRIQEALAPTAHQTRRELDRLLNFIEAARVPKDVQSAIPVYDLTNLVLRTRSAAEQFHEHWNARLGFDYKTDVPTEHWTRVKALSRRFANQWEDQFDTLRPVADMIKFQSERFAEFISTPHDWDPLNAPDEVKEMVAGKVAQEFYSRLHTLISERFTHDHLNEWVSAYGYRGTGSTRLRARDIRGIYESASPIPLETPAPDASSFLDAIRHLFREAALAAGGRVVG